ncbi:MAG: hypothetical protein ACFFB0_21110 [Promethearchaeota archaeon]
MSVIGYSAIMFGVIFIILGLATVLYYIAIWFKANENFKINFARQGNFIVAILMLHFLFYGFIANEFGKDIGEDILFTYKILFSPQSWFSLFILIAIIFFVVLREHFFEYGIRNSIMLTPIIIGMSWFWYWFIVEFDVTIIPLYFIRAEAYLTIITILGINFASAILASILKQIYKEYIKTTKGLIIIEE